MTETEREKAIAAHLADHERRHVKRRKSRLSADNRKKARGLQAAVDRMKAKPS